MEQPIPEPDPVAMARQKYELENRETAGFMGHFWGVFSHGPDMSMAAKSGQPAMESLKPETPVTVRLPASAATSSDVTATTITGPSALDTNPDARQNRSTPNQPAPNQSAPNQAAPAQSTPSQQQNQGGQNSK